MIALTVGIAVMALATAVARRGEDFDRHVDEALRIANEGHL